MFIEVPHSGDTFEDSPPPFLQQPPALWIPASGFAPALSNCHLSPITAGDQDQAPACISPWAPTVVRLSSYNPLPTGTHEHAVWAAAPAIYAPSEPQFLQRQCQPGTLGDLALPPLSADVRDMPLINSGLEYVPVGGSSQAPQSWYDFWPSSSRTVDVFLPVSKHSEGPHGGNGGGFPVVSASSSVSSFPPLTAASTVPSLVAFSGLFLNEFPTPSSRSSVETGASLPANHHPPFYPEPALGAPFSFASLAANDNHSPANDWTADSLGTSVATGPVPSSFQCPSSQLYTHVLQLEESLMARPVPVLENGEQSLLDTVLAMMLRDMSSQPDSTVPYDYPHPSTGNVSMADYGTVPPYTDTAAPQSPSAALSAPPLRSPVPLAERLQQDQDVLKRSITRGKKGGYRCTHCSGLFLTLVEFASHLDEFGIVRPNKCPVRGCPWRIIGLSRQTELRRHCMTQHQMSLSKAALGGGQVLSLEASGSERTSPSGAFDSDGQEKPHAGKPSPKHRGLPFPCGHSHCIKLFRRQDLLRRHHRLVHENPQSRFNRNRRAGQRRGRTRGSPDWD